METFHPTNPAVLSLLQAERFTYMEKWDEELIARLLPHDEELRKQVATHRKFEEQLEEFNRRPYLTTEEAMEKKRIQKLKLAGRDRIEAILARYRQQG
jgi:hypothetical protein